VPRRGEHLPAPHRPHGRAGAKGVAVTFVDWDDMPKWGPDQQGPRAAFPEPVETYSSSKHLYTDLGIPEGTKGTLPASARVRAGLHAERSRTSARPAAASRPGATGAATGGATVGACRS
jgi:hypothetical protein